MIGVLRFVLLIIKESLPSSPYSGTGGEGKLFVMSVGSPCLLMESASKTEEDLGKLVWFTYDP